MFKLHCKVFIASFIVCSSLLAQHVAAQTGTTPKPPDKPASKPAKSSKQTPKTAPAAEKTAAMLEDEEDSKTPDITGSDVTEFICDHGQKITLYRNPGDEKFIAMRWQKHIMRMRSVATSTGAERFENRRHGMLWIGIPAKSMLLDSKKGQQLANECRTVEQTNALEKK